jgi:methionyl-tRNA formyltransferase
LLPKDTQPGFGKFLPAAQLIAIACKGGGEIHVTKLQPPGKKPLLAKDWWNGVRKSYLQEGFLPFGVE